MFSKLTNYVTWKHALVGAAIFIIGAVLPGCLGNIVPANPPAGALNRQVGGQPIPEKLTYNKSVKWFQAYTAQEDAFTAMWSDNLSEAKDKIELWNLAIDDLTSPASLLQFGINPASGGASLGLYAMGLFTRRPGDKKKIQEAKSEPAQPTA